MRTTAVALSLRQMGFPVISTTEADDQYDGEITISAEVSVQVCSFSTALIVNRFDGETFHHSPPVTKSEDLAKCVKEALEEAEKHPIPDHLKYLTEE